MSVAHIPSWPTTSYNGDWRTKNSSAAFADDTHVSKWSLEWTKEIALTESVQSSSSEHEEVTFDLIRSFVILVSELIRSDEHP